MADKFNTQEEILYELRGLFRKVEPSNAPHCYVCQRRVRDYVSGETVRQGVMNNQAPRDVDKLVERLGASIYMMMVDGPLLIFGIHAIPGEPWQGYETCPDCDGTGHTLQNCPHCEGVGGDPECLCWGKGFSPCKYCDGYGRVMKGNPTRPTAVTLRKHTPEMYDALLNIIQSTYKGGSRIDPVLFRELTSLFNQIQGAKNVK